MSDRFLAIDGGIRAGWATNARGIYSGVQSFEQARGTSSGCLWIQFSRWLDESLDCWRPDLVVYEMPLVHHRGSAQSEISWGMVTRIHQACAERGINYRGVHVSTLKAAMAGSGRADKNRMRLYAEERWSHYVPSRDPGGDESDALALLAYAIDGFPEADKPKRARARKTATPQPRLEMR